MSARTRTTHTSIVFGGIVKSRAKLQEVVIPLINQIDSVQSDLAFIDFVRSQLTDNEVLAIDRNTIREVGRIRIRWNLAKQRDDEKYDEYLSRIADYLREIFVEATKE